MSDGGPEAPNFLHRETGRDRANSFWGDVYRDTIAAEWEHLRRRWPEWWKRCVDAGQETDRSPQVRIDRSYAVAAAPLHGTT